MRRRCNRHIYHTPNGSWSAIVQHGGRRVTVTAKSKRDLQHKAAEKLLELGGTLEASATTVDMLIGEWRLTRTHSPMYAADVSRVVSRLPAAFLERTIDTVKPPVIVHLYRTLMVQGWSPNRLHRLHSILLPAFALAVDYEWAPTNPVARVKPPKVDTPDVGAPTVTDVTRLLDAVEGTTFGLYLELAVITGARRGEAVAFQWDDFDGQSIRIRRSVVWTPADPDATWQTGLVVTEGKTGRKGHRNVALPAHLAARLSALRHRQITGSMENGLPARPIWIFSHDLGRTCWLPGYATNEFISLRNELGIAGVRLHDLRHFMATQLLAAGEAPTTVGKRMGHTTQSTLAKYTDYVLASDQRAADTMERILNRG